MSCIYNEKVKRSVAPLVCLLVIFGLSLIMVSYFGTKIGLTEEMKTAMDLVLTMVFLLAGYAAVTKAREVYRYSIIADDLIIHRISGDKNHLVRRVKLSAVNIRMKEMQSHSTSARVSQCSIKSIIHSGHHSFYDVL